MSISDYTAKLESAINSFAIVAAYNITVDRKTMDIAFISGRIDFRDGTTLDFKEFVEEIDGNIEKYKYSYNYRKDHVSLFRFDNAADPHAKSLRTFPHHKHIEDRYIVEAHQTELFSVITEIEEIYISGESG